MDGLLLDSERICRLHFQAACEFVGIECDLDVYSRCIGATGDITRQILIDHHGADFPYDEVSARWWETYHEEVLVNPVPVKPGAREWLTLVKQNDLPLALATSTIRATAQTKLRLAGLDHFFDELVCGRETPRGKPHPDPYLLACQKLGQAAVDCWACEDSDNGTQAAIDAGLTVFQVPDLLAPSEQTRAHGHRIVGSLVEVIDYFHLAHR
ncbi:MAG: HAD family phosphatase [Proteobacteria bacterium]|nr:HAD family phosphatase [Pseudomonadota bacterium]